MTQNTVSITTIIHTKPVTWEELLARVSAGETTYDDELVLRHLRNELDCIAATYPGHEYFTYLARLLGQHQQMSPGAPVEGNEDDDAYLADAAAEKANPELMESVRNVERALLSKPIILGGKG